jgi:hypothetical protein
MHEILNKWVNWRLEFLLSTEKALGYFKIFMNQQLVYSMTGVTANRLTGEQFRVGMIIH